MIEVGTWVKYTPDDAFGYVTDIEKVTSEITIYWFDLEITSTEMPRAFDSEFGEFEILGKPEPHEELVWKMKYL
jgi:hypothetical protein